jgi:hypothetical protein
MLADNQAQLADNVKLYSHELRYWKGPVAQSATLPSNCQSIFKYYASSPTPYWLAWANAGVDVALSPIADVSDYRFYYTGDGVPKKSNETLVNTGTGPFPRSWLNMGVPAPVSAPHCTVARGGGVTVTITSANPGVVTQTAHGYVAGQIVEPHISAGGALPTNLTSGNQYFARNVTTNTYELGIDLYATTSIDCTAGTQSGVITMYADDNPENRTYVYTYTSTFGAVTEESAPSPPSSIVQLYDGPGTLPYTGDTVTVNTFASPPTTNYNITGINIYRSVTGATTDEYLFVASIPIATTSYADSLGPTALGNALGTLTWTPPPSTLKGLVSLPSGALAGFTGNTVYFSEPDFPHAWPLNYAIALPNPIVGLGVFGSSLAVMTDRYPYVIDGGIPGAMSVQRIPALEPCLTKRSIVATGAGIWYASPNGMMQVGPGGSGVQTTPLFRRDEWQALLPANLIATLYDTKYFGLYPSLSGYTPFVLSIDDTPAMSTVDIAANAVHVDAQNGNLYYVDPPSNTIFQADADPLNPLNYKWMSKRFVMPQVTTFSVIKVDGDFAQQAVASAYNAQTAAEKAANAALFSSNLLGALNSTPLDVYTVDGSIMANIPPFAALLTAQVMIYGDEQLKVTMSFSDFGCHRIPAFKSKTIEMAINGTVSIRSVSIATTVQEMVAT